MDLTPQEAVDILSEGYPQPEDLKRFPFGDLLERLWSREDDDGKEYREHGPKVLQAMNKLLGSNPATLMGRNSDDTSRQMLDETKVEIEKLFIRFDDTARSLFRLAALYHDIGKYIIKERHPTVGWYTLEYLNPQDKDDLRTLLGDREDYLDLLLVMIRDHDQFGVLSTGEASYPIMLKAATALGKAVEDQKRTISAIMWLNLADMAGTPGLTFTPDDLVKVIKDWRWFLNALDVCGKTKQRLDDYVINEAGSEYLVEERISRLILEASRNWPARLADLHVRKGNELKIYQSVHKQIQTVYPTQIPRQEFSFQFTHICKLDYGKRFFSCLVEFCEGPPKPGEKRYLPIYADERLDSESLIYAVLAILRRMTSTYLAMMRSDSGPGNLIGVEMKDLAPRNAPDKTAQIIKLLLKSHYPGLSWLMSDCLAWYF